MNHIVETYPLTKFEGGLNLLHKADYYYYYYAAFNAPCVSHKDDDSQVR